MYTPRAKTGMIIIQNRPFKREQLRGNPAVLFAWEDTLEHKRSHLSQTRFARECHGEMNAVAFVTKKLAGDAPYCNFTDDDAREGSPALENLKNAFGRLEHHLRRGGQVYFPGQPIGTQANLLRSAPMLWGAIERMRLQLYRDFPIHSAIETKVA